MLLNTEKNKQTNYCWRLKAKGIPASGRPSDSNHVQGNCEVTAAEYTATPSVSGMYLGVS